MIKHLVKQSGFSMMEVMIAVAVLAIIVSLAVPSMNTMYSRSEVAAAQQNVAQALRKAKQFARSVNTTVTVTLTLNEKDNTIAFSLPDGSSELPDGIRMNTITLPGEVSVSSDNETYSFNSLGVVDNTGVTTLTSARDSNMTKSVTLLNILGQLQVD